MKQEYNIGELQLVAENFTKWLGEQKVVALHGNMGAGKTTFISAVCRALGTMDHSSSPTFSIINEYRTGSGQKIYHMDWYRIKDVEEAINAGIEDALYSGNTCFVEWPEKAAFLLPVDTVHVWLEATCEESRCISYGEI